MKTLRRWLLRLLLLCLALTLVPVAVLRWAPPPTSSVILQRWISEGASQAYAWTPLEQIAPAAALAVVAAEDQKFPMHRGFDLEAIEDALLEHLEGGQLRGASTLSQQVARNLFLWQGRSMARKGLEAWYTLWIELLWPKRRVLEVYLNIAEMGERTFGVGPASRRFFDHPPAELSREQAALLAAVLPNPRRLRADRPSDYVRQRQRWILHQMRQLGGPAYLADILERR
jgi:monofunctional biosynthetic peptidoglycan transglycosylase